MLSKWKRGQAERSAREALAAQEALRAKNETEETERRVNARALRQEKMRVKKRDESIIQGINNAYFITEINWRPPARAQKLRLMLR